MTVRRLGESELIAEYLASLAHPTASFGFQDDAAFLAAIPTSGLVITADAVVAGVHFFEADQPGDVAYKALAVNISDLAAKAAKPLGYTMTLALPDAPTDIWARDFAAGLEGAQNKFGVKLLGGDTVAARGGWWMAITAFGEAASRGMVRRGGAASGDAVYVSGTLGDSALGLRLRLEPRIFPSLSTADQDYLRKRYLYPQPRLQLSGPLAHYASAAMDISDGLTIDLGRLCKASGVSATIDVEAIPLSQAASALLSVSEAHIIQSCLCGGDDYEILATIPSIHANAFEAAARNTGITVTRIGSVMEGLAPPRFRDANGKDVTLSAVGFTHF